MRCCINILKKHWKIILIYAVSISIGIIFAITSNTIREDTAYQQITKPINNNWIVIGITFAIMIAIVIAGYFAGKRYDRQDN